MISMTFFQTQNFFVTGKCIGQPYCNIGMPDPFKTAAAKGPKPSPTPDI